ncbi:NAD-dependent epimerase/dehydratase family protein [Draconibacterium halophilum]|uniref:NAD-dependent epimerase/dehydratase family protein n=1 Tax=Draconibacterium halophilum TaxID=2706887 RepID=A0A6C0RJ54_9BACT|nr:NAD-dependent epimerase/dehydratase family protein [Draconibacterium halophilum]QIA09645.1 NAD-dependent epimerase/dehydratase family protein [Draconibacterium halophilum]
MKKAGIIGGSDLIGSYISLKFLAEDYKVKVQISNKRQIKKDPLYKNISINQNIEFHETDLNNAEQVQRFIKDCELVIHCGDPICLNIKSSETMVYATVIKQTGTLFKAIQKSSSIRKVIFITCATAFNPEYISTETERYDHIVKTKNNPVDKAKYHASKAIYKVLNCLPDNLFEVIFISPIEVRNHQLSSSTDSTATSLQSLFRKKITPDPFFQKLLERQVIDRFTNIEELPEKVFQAAAIDELTEMLKIT